MSFETIETERRDNVMVITLNRPERLNAWTYRMGAELRMAVEAANADDDVGAIVLTGAGRGFCAGADIEAVFKAQSEGDDVEGSNDTGNWVEIVRQAKPMIAAVNGAAIGVGLTQVLPCDFIVASEAAKLSLRFVKMGLVPELASSRFLYARVGWGHANELMLTGKTVNAEEALNIGLVDKVTSSEDLLSEACTLAGQMAENPQGAVKQIKDLITQNAAESDLRDAQKREMSALHAAYSSPEHKEAIAAFMEKRDPDFKAARQGSS